MKKTHCCICGKPKAARRYRYCGTCYKNLSEETKATLEKKSRENKQGSLRRWK